jgi:hypothetical protein
MLDFRKIGELADKLKPLPDDDWTLRWNVRGKSVRAVLGDTVEPGMVQSFSWKDYILPGACAMTFKTSHGGEDGWLYMTLGLTQPLRLTDKAFPWEFCVRTKERVTWAVDLLYQLLSQWLWEKGDVGFGYHLPLRFFIGHDGNMWASISERVQHREVVGTIRGLHLWTDATRMKFGTSSDEFGLLTAVCVTEEEDHLADATSPAHLMLLLRCMGICQICDPYRRSVLSIPGGIDQWRRIEGMSHDDAFDELQRMETEMSSNK